MGLLVLTAEDHISHAGLFFTRVDGIKLLENTAAPVDGFVFFEKTNFRLI